MFSSILITDIVNLWKDESSLHLIFILYNAIKIHILAKS